MRYFFVHLLHNATQYINPNTGKLVGNAYTLVFLIKNQQLIQELKSYDNLLANDFIQYTNNRKQIYKNNENALLLLNTLLEDIESNAHYICKIMSEKENAEQYQWKSFHFLKNPNWALWVERLNDNHIKNHLINKFCSLGNKDLAVLEKAVAINFATAGKMTCIEEMIPQVSDKELLSIMNKLIIDPQSIKREKNIKQKQLYVDKISIIYRMPKEYWAKANNLKWDNKKIEKVEKILASNDDKGLDRMINPKEQANKVQRASKSNFASRLKKL